MVATPVTGSRSRRPLVVAVGLLGASLVSVVVGVLAATLTGRDEWLGVLLPQPLLHLVAVGFAARATLVARRWAEASGAAVAALVVAVLLALVSTVVVGGLLLFSYGMAQG